jgi:dTDP-4-amino-4,6-dideoxy-D-galactose acyltransferase
MTIDFSERLDLCQDRLFFYSPYRFIPGRDRRTIFKHTIRSPFMDKINQGVITTKEIAVRSEPHSVLTEHLTWDTGYFGFPVFRMITALYAHDNYGLLRNAIQEWFSDLTSHGHAFYFTEIPSEDTFLIQALCECGFRLTETRLHYVFSGIGSYSRERYPVRKACEDDIENLRTVAVRMRNPYDRLHADTAFSRERADAYLATYIENSVRGFSDLVLVPAEGDGPPDGFHTSSFPASVLGQRVAKFGVVAILSETRKGWMKKMISETIYELREKETDHILVNTQAPNRAVQAVFDSFGFKLVFVTHIFSRIIA